MKKLLSIVAVAVAAALWYVVPVFAVTMDFSGDYRVRGFMVQNYYNNSESDPGSELTDRNWLDARFRLTTIVKQGIASGVVQLDLLQNDTADGCTTVTGTGI